MEKLFLILLGLVLFQGLVLGACISSTPISWLRRSLKGKNAATIVPAISLNRRLVVHNAANKIPRPAKYVPIIFLRPGRGFWRKPHFFNRVYAIATLVCFSLISAESLPEKGR